MSNWFSHNTKEALMTFWIALFIILLVAELISVGLTTIWFAIGALVALATCAVEAGFWLQVLVFLGVSVMMLCLARPVAVRKINKRHFRTNYEALAGKTVKITERVDNLAGTGKGTVNGMEWTVRSMVDSECLEEGSYAIIKNVSGVKLIVMKEEQEK